MNFLLIEHGGLKKGFTIEALLKKDLNVYLACTELPEWVSKILPKENVIITDTYNSTKLLSDILSFMLTNNIDFDAMGTFYEHTVCQTADIAKALNLKGIDPGAARRSSANKALMRKVCSDAGIRTPKFITIKELTEDNLKKAISTIGLPCVIKPIFGAGSYGTLKLEKDTDIKKSILEIKNNTTATKKETFKNFTGVFLIEEYLSGKMISIDGIVNNNKIFILGSIEFIMGPEPRFTQEANYIPARLDKQTIQAAEEMTKKIITTLDFNNCGFHCELRITKDGPVLVEIAARLPGGPLQPGYLNATGIDLTSKLIDLWLGKDISLTKTCNKYVLQKAVFPKEKGFLKVISGIEELSKMEGVWDSIQIAKVGEEIITYPDIPIPLYYYAIVANTELELNELSCKVENSIQIVIK